ncbi:hypothetical protein NBRC116188_07120 [Oceaniserpentilla sp. 4NH20-0058]
MSLLASGADWWNISDDAFANEYVNEAFSEDIEQQSEVAWMLFARVNQQVQDQGKTLSVWETWPSNQNTFSPAVPKFTFDNKVRARPHLQLPKLMKGMTPKEQLAAPPVNGGEEVTRNMFSYDYIMAKGLNSKAGVLKFLSGSNTKVDFPIGTVEIKADWETQAIEGAYQFVDTENNVTYSLVGLHIMAKMQPTPENPFYSETPSWFWTTFEFKGNPGLANAQNLITYKDALSSSKAQMLLQQAGLADTAFVNYVSNGTQIRYSDAQHPDIILGNTKMEAFAGSPDQNDPSTWTKWNSSCHTCHGTTSAKIDTSGSTPMVKFYPFTVPVGKITYQDIDQYTSMDFVWSIAFYAQ